MADDWQLSRSVTQCNQYMLEQQIATDVVFIVYHTCEKGTVCGDGNTRKRAKGCVEINNNCAKVSSTTTSVRIKAHKYMLVSRSPVFYAMFLGPLAEQGEVTVTDCQPEAFRQMLNFIYSEEATVTTENIEDLVYIAKKYMIPGLVKFCEEQFIDLLHPSNACQLLELSLKIGVPNMTEDCLSMLRFHIDDCLDYPASFDISIEALEVILNLDLITTEEVKMFEFCLNWAAHEVGKTGLKVTVDNMRKVLSHCLFLVRYLAMPVTDFADVVSNKGLLNGDERLQIYQYLCETEKSAVPLNLCSVNRSVEICDNEVSLGLTAEKSILFRSLNVDLEIDVLKPIFLTYITIGSVDIASAHLVHKFSGLKHNNKHLKNGLIFNDNSELDQDPHNVCLDIKDKPLIFKQGIHLWSGIHKFSFKLEMLDEDFNSCEVVFKFPCIEDRKEVDVYYIGDGETFNPLSCRIDVKCVEIDGQVDRDKLFPVRHLGFCLAKSHRREVHV